MRVSDITILREAPEDLAKLKAAIAHLKTNSQPQSTPNQPAARSSASASGGDIYARIDDVIARASSYKDIRDALENIPQEMAPRNNFQQLEIKNRLIRYVNRKHLGGTDQNAGVDAVQVAKQVFQQKSNQAQPETPNEN